MTELIGLDFETYGAVDLPVHGLERYTSDKSFTPLIGCAAMREKGVIQKWTFDFIADRRASRRDLEEVIGSKRIVAHNAGFEERVLSHINLDYPMDRFIDSAVVARVAGAASKLEAAAPQLLGTDKLEAGKQLMVLFSMPGKYQEASGSRMFDPQVIADHPDEWAKYIQYCELDAKLGLLIVEHYLHRLVPGELEYQAITMEMNRTGWPVDIDKVEEMQRRYLENQEQALYDFRQRHQATELNLNSLKQQKEWCAKRGVKATSFDEKHVASLLARIEKKLTGPGPLTPEQIDNYSAVEDLLRTKQILGGSSLKKLQVILDTASPDTWRPGTHRLKDQYLHCGAGQTLRTTGRSVQMQNLKRLSTIADMDELDDPDSEWDNTKLAQNLRQVFTSSDPYGRLIVGDFSSVESRGLAWLAWEDWKLEAYRQGKDMYKVLAATSYGVAYDVVNKEQRTFGKVGELSCGYQAGGDAVQSFASGMDVHLTGAEASKLVSDWRAACPATVEFWAVLDDMLHDVVERGLRGRLALKDGLELRMYRVDTPSTLLAQHPGAKSVMLEIVYAIGGKPFMKRVFHGCYVRGGSICYYKPSDRKTGDLWRNNYVDPKTKQIRFYGLYGGKLAGITTQSFCRQLFFQSLAEVHRWVRHHSGQLSLVGQFHDEIVVDWRPGALSLEDAMAQLERIMSDPGLVTSFPLAAEVKCDYRYTK